MKRFLVLQLALLCVACEGGETDDSGGGGGGGGTGALLIETESGPVEGFLDGTTRTYLGVPFAEPPLGDLRWAPPSPRAPWTEKLQAIARGPSCPQLNPLNGAFAVGSSEDCLTLNVWTPEQPGSDPLPVLFWIHGGGFVLGSGGEGAYDGRALSETTHAVVVTINYRLGPLGFLALPELTAEDSTHPSSGAYGLEDQRLALSWVKANAAAFGGDPSRVMIFGESAGGASVCHHLVSPLSEGLFSSAVLESGPCDLVTLETDALAQGADLVTALGCDGAGVLSCMREQSLEDVLTALPAPSFGASPDGSSWSPVVDGHNLPDVPSALLASGSFTKVPTILGTNADEATLFFQLGGQTVADDAAFEALVEAASPGNGAEVVAQYPASEYGSSNAAAIAAFGDAAFVCPTRRAARALSAAGVPTFLYHFTYGPASLFGELGAFHSAEIKFVFGTPGQLLPQPLTEQELVLSGAMMGYWSRLASVGEPNVEGALAWPAYSAATDQNIVFDLSLSTQTGLHAAQCDFWDGITLPL